MALSKSSMTGKGLLELVQGKAGTLKQRKTQSSNHVV